MPSTRWLKRVADGIPAYEVKNDANKKRQVLHWARLLLWLAETGRRATQD